MLRRAEPLRDRAQRGSICVITGPMFARKSTMLAAEKERAERARLVTILFVPACDTRYDASGSSLATHNGLLVAGRRLDESLPMHESTREHAAAITAADVVLIDECQWFSGLYDFCMGMAAHGKRVIVAGLTTKSDLSLFGETYRVAAVAEQHMHLTAVCIDCTADAHFTGLTWAGHARAARRRRAAAPSTPSPHALRNDGGDSFVPEVAYEAPLTAAPLFDAADSKDVGADDDYAARCRACYAAHLETYAKALASWTALEGVVGH